MKRTFDLSKLNWQLTGSTPHEWQLDQTMEINATPRLETPPLPAPVPGSVQKALLDADLIPDWNIGLNSHLCEWVENRHWIYETKIPDRWLKLGKKFRLRCLGLDYNGKIRINSKEIYEFKNSHVPHIINLTPHLAKKNNILQIIFECPPRYLGQFGFSSQMTDWKPRFNYGWDWIIRMVQIGICDKIFFEVIDPAEITALKTIADIDMKCKKGTLKMTGSVSAKKNLTVTAELKKGKTIVKAQKIGAADFSRNGFNWKNLNVKLWQPNGTGTTPLYTLTIKLTDSSGNELDRIERRLGFRNISWQKCQGAEHADPWICVVNGEPVFMQGINWTPIRPNFADLTEEDYRKRLQLYKDLGFNIMRIWGGGFLEKECFYNLCDKLGIMVWQEFPLSMSGSDGTPPTDEKSIEELSQIARSFITRRQHHASLIIWCGGNELLYDWDEGRGNYYPMGLEHPLLNRFNKIVKQLDPTRRFTPTSPSGPKVHAWGDFGKGLHWDVHGPWKIDSTMEKYKEYWQQDDALLRTEVGVPSPSPAKLIDKYKGDLPATPGTIDNPLWRRASWWIEWPVFVKENRRQPKSLAEFVNWGQKRQADALCIAVKSCKDSFPKCGGIFIWIGHDSYPATATNAIVDFEANPKPAALALAKILKNP